MATSSLSPSLARGIATLTSLLQAIPGKPGIYQMLGSQNEVLYVGKAKNLYNRVSQYRQTDRLPYRLQKMVASIFDVKTYTTSTEAEALLLEANLIKQKQPPYNILLKDDKSYPYILVTKNHDYPSINKHRGKHSTAGNYYGPFASPRAVNQAIIDLQKAFLVRPCSDSYFASRTRPCMEYQIKRCSGPCTSKISKEDYDELVRQLNRFLNGKSRNVQEELATKMQSHSDQMEYEKAAIVRDRIKALNHIQAKQIIYIDQLKNADIIGFARHDGKACIEICFFRNHQNFGSRSYFFEHSEEIAEETIIENFLLQFYQNHIAPAMVLLPITPFNIESLKIALAEIAGHHVDIRIPQRGDQKHIIDSVTHNAESSLRQNQVKELKQTHLLSQVATLFHLPHIPQRIEVYDNSHISGTHSIGAMIVANSQGFDKSSYRKFNIKLPETKAGDDYGMMREVLRRRLSRLLKEHPSQVPGIWPDLLLIDGGAGQLSSVIEVLTELNLQDSIAVVGIAKGRDRNAGRENFFLPGKATFMLPPHDKTLHYLQTLRDEAHRYVITSHRAKRTKAMSFSTLDTITSVGPKRKKALLRHFGSVEALKEASLDDIKKVTGINKKTAEIIYHFFHS
jgi:excinuclease ABC subunit C